MAKQVRDVVERLLVKVGSVGAESLPALKGARRLPNVARQRHAEFYLWHAHLAQIVELETLIQDNPSDAAAVSSGLYVPGIAGITATPHAFVYVNRGVTIYL